jgi:glycosyltransferase involved in cell wall biosynthesis
MDVTVTIPTLNEENYLPRCLSDLEQAIAYAADDHTFEVIIVDSYSDDATVEIADAHPVVDDVILTGKGILKARDRGIREASGEVVVCMDADTTYPETFLSRIIQPFIEDESTTIAYGPAYGERTQFQLDSGIRYILQKTLRHVGLAWVNGSNRAIKKSAYNKLGGYNLDRDSQSVFKVMYEEQSMFPLKLKREGKMAYIDDAPSYQSHRTVDQLLLLRRKDGGKSWNIINHYAIISSLKSFFWRGE